MKIRCLFKHDFKRSLEFTPILEPTDDPRLSLIKVVENWKCTRWGCTKQKRSEEVVPFQYIVDDE